MAGIKALTWLVLLGCLLLMTDSSPIKGKEETLTSRPSKISRVKTVPRVPGSSQTSISKPWSRSDFRSTTVHVDSSVTPPSVVIENTDQAPQSQGKRNSVSHSVKTFTRGPHNRRTTLSSPWNRRDSQSTAANVHPSVTPPSVAIHNSDRTTVSQGSQKSVPHSAKTVTRVTQSQQPSTSNPWNRGDFQSTTVHVGSSVTPPSVDIHRPDQAALPQGQKKSVIKSVKTFTQLPQSQRSSTSWNRPDLNPTTAHVFSSVTPPSVAIKSPNQAVLPQDNLNSGAQSVKTFTRVSQNQRTSFSNRQNRPAFQSTTTRFDSRVTPSLEVIQNSDQINLSQDNQNYDAPSVNGDISQVSSGQRVPEEQKFSIAEHHSSQTVRTPGRHSHLPAITNFGSRVQKIDQDSTFSRCRVKGGCPSASSTPGVQTPFDNVKNVDNSLQQVKKSTEGSIGSSRDQQSIFAESTFSQTGSVFETKQTNKDSQSFPVNVPHSQNDEQFKVSSDIPAPESNGVHLDQKAIQTDFKPDLQFVNQQGFPDNQNHQHSAGNFPVQQQDFSGHSTDQTFDNSRPNHDEQNHQHSAGNFPVQQQDFSGHSTDQTFDNSRKNHDEQRRVDATSAFGQTSSRDVFQSSVTGVQKPFDSSVSSQGGSSFVSFDDTPRHSDDGQYYHYGDPIEALRYNVPGNPGEDYPILYQVPFTSFDCRNQAFSAGIYGDVEASCQVFHVCKDNGGQDSFLCPNGTVFNQQYFVCDWWYNFRCADTPSFYSLNADLYWDWDSFTPTDVLNVPPARNDGFNLQGNSQGNFGGNEQGHSVVAGQNNGVQSVGAFQNPVPVTRNDFQNTQHSFHEQSREEHTFTSGFSGTTGRIDSVTAAPISGNRIPNVQASVDQGFTNTRVENNFQTTISDTGIDSQTAIDTGAQYPDQQTHIQQFNEDFPSQDQFNAEGIVPIGFDDGTSFGNSDSGRTDMNQNNFGLDTSVGNELSINQDVRPTDVRKDVQGITQTQIREETLPNSFDRDASHVTNPAFQVGDVQSSPDSFTPQNQGSSHVTNPAFQVGDVQSSHDSFIPRNQGSSHVNNPAFQVGDVQTSHDSFMPQNQGSGVFDANEISQNHQISQNQLPSFDINQQDIATDQNFHNGQAHNSQSNFDVAQENIFTNFEDNRQENFNGENFGPQTQNTFTPDHISSTHGTRGTDNSGNSRSTDSPVFQDQQEVHQEHISSSFDDRKTQDIGGVSHDSRVSSFNEQKDTTGDFGSFDNVPTIADTQNIVGNENQQQEQIPFFGDNRDNGVLDSTGNVRDDFNPQTTVDNNLQISGASFDSHSNVGNQNTNANQGVQQEHISSIDVIHQNRFEFNENSAFKPDENRGQGQVSASFQPNTQTLNNDGGYRTQDVGENFAVSQDHVSIPFSGFDGTADDDRSLNKKIQEEFSTTLTRGSTLPSDNQGISVVRNNDKNSFQVTEQRHLPDQLGGIQSSLPNINEQKQISHSLSVPSQTFGSEIKGSNIPIENQSFKQDSKSVSSGANLGQVSVHGSSQSHQASISSQHQVSSSFASDGQSISGDKTFGNQQNTGVGIQQTDVPVVFDENRGFQGNVNNNGLQQQQFDNSFNQGSGVSSNTPHNFGGSNVPSNVNPSQVPELQQHGISSFNVQQSNVFNSDGNDRRQTMQNNYENRQEQQQQFNSFQQSNFRVNSNQQQNFQVSQNLRQENIPTSFENTNQDNFNPGNVFNQVNNQGNFHPQNQFVPTDNQQNILAVQVNEENQNTNGAFQQPLNDFHPTDIHTVNQGGVQNIDDQQRLNFRPYGQNNQNTVIFPDGQNRILIIPNQFSVDQATFQNNGGPSNQNFFVTNGHQVLNEQQQQNVQGHSPNQDIQPDVRHRGAQNIVKFNNNPGFFSSGNGYSDAQNTRNSQFDEPSPRDFNQNINSRVKGYSSENFRNGRNLGQGSPMIAISAGDAVPQHHATPESPSSVSYNGWRPIIKH